MAFCNRQKLRNDALQSGAGYRTRTYDPLITNQVLYQLS